MLQAPYHLLASMRQLWPTFEAELQGLEMLRQAGILSWPAWCQVPLEYAAARYMRAVAHELEMVDDNVEREDVPDIEELAFVMASVCGELAIVLNAWRQRQTVLRGHPYPFHDYLTLGDLAWLEEVPYIAFERPFVFQDRLYGGAFVWVNYNPSEKSQELRLVLCSAREAQGVSFSLQEEGSLWRIGAPESLLISTSAAHLLLRHTVGFLQACGSADAELIVRVQRGLSYLELV